MHTHSLSIHPDSGRALRPWELALLLAVCVTLLAGTWAQARSQLLAARLVRLHVIAVSDDETEQAVKLQVRDAVLAYLEPQLADVTDIDAAEQIIAGDLDGIAHAAQVAAGERPVRVSLGPEHYPTRDYGTFALPAGARGTTGGASSSRRCARRRRDCRSRRCRRSRTTMCASSRSPAAAMSCASGCWSCGTRSCSG